MNAALKGSESLAPHSVEAEQNLLGSLLLDQEQWARVQADLGEGDFFRPDHRLIYRAIADLRRAGIASDVVTVAEHLKLGHQLNEAGGQAYLLTLARDTGQPANAAIYADIIKSHAQNRALVSLGGVLADPDLSAAQKVARATDAIARIPLPRANPPIEVTVTCGKDVQIEPISWLWSGWLAAGKLHILAGCPGTGKTTIALALAATVSKGGRWPDGSSFLAPGNVLIWSGEDDPSDTLVPRLIAAGADLGRVHFVSETTDRQMKRPFDPATDMAALIEKARAVGNVSLLIVDPVVNSVSGDSHKNGEVRRGLQPLVTFGHEIQAVVLGISHFSKGTAGRDPLERLTGSLAFGALARLVFGAAKKTDANGEEEGRVFVRIKSNIGPDGGALAYSLESAEVASGVVTSKVQWGNAIEGSARDILAEAEQTPDDLDDSSQLGEAKAFLLKVLAGGPIPARQIFAEARDAGHAERTLKRAKADLGIESTKGEMSGKWAWSLPTKGAKGGQDCRTQNVGTLGPLRKQVGQTDEECQEGQGFVSGDSGPLRDAEAF